MSIKTAGRTEHFFEAISQLQCRNLGERRYCSGGYMGKKRRDEGSMYFVCVADVSQ